MRRFRTLNRIYAHLRGHFWLRCPRCGQMFGGQHETGTATEPIGGYGGIPETLKACCWRHDKPVQHAVR